MSGPKAPGVFKEVLHEPPADSLLTGVPAFLGFATPKNGNRGLASAQAVRSLAQWSQYRSGFAPPPNGVPDCMDYAIRGFFENEGRCCYVLLLPDGGDRETTLGQGLALLAPLQEIDLICAPGIMAETDPTRLTRLQNLILEECDRAGDRFAILDGVKDAKEQEVLEQQRRLAGCNGALYYPWIRVSDPGAQRMTPGKPAAQPILVPPCGHIAGIYARVDATRGVHKAPANELLEGVIDLAEFDQARLGELNDNNINCLQAFPGRGIRVWGARTLSQDPAWRYVNVRRLFLTAGRWMERSMTDLVFEPNDRMLWARVTRELTAYCVGLLQRGALKGRTAEEAFYVKCDEEINPPAQREAGRVVTEIGLAPAAPSEFIVVRIVHGASGVSITGPQRP